MATGKRSIHPYMTAWAWIAALCQADGAHTLSELKIYGHHVERMSEGLLKAARCSQPGLDFKRQIELGCGTKRTGQTHKVLKTYPSAEFTYQSIVAAQNNEHRLLIYSGTDGSQVQPYLQAIANQIDQNQTFYQTKLGQNLVNAAIMSACACGLNTTQQKSAAEEIALIYQKIGVTTVPSIEEFQQAGECGEVPGDLKKWMQEGDDW